MRKIHKNGSVFIPNGGTNEEESCALKDNLLLVLKEVRLRSIRVQRCFIRRQRFIQKTKGGEMIPPAHFLLRRPEGKLLGGPRPDGLRFGGP